MEEAAKKKANQEMIGNLTEQLEDLESEVKSGVLKEKRMEEELQQKKAKWAKERLEAKKKEEEWEQEREELKESLRQKEKELGLERFLWGAKFDEASFDSWTRKKIACLLYNSACAATEKDLPSGEEETELGGRDKALQRVATCMGTFPDVVESWVTQPLVSSGPSGVFSKESEPFALSGLVVGGARSSHGEPRSTSGWANTTGSAEELEWGEEFLSDEGSGDQCGLESDYLC